MHSIETIRQEVHTAMEELLTVAKVHEGQLFVVGCSTSEICGKKIGTDSHEDVAAVVFDEIYKAVSERGLYLAVQCCEHLNRALVMEREAMTWEEECNVVPQLHAGGAMAMTAYGINVDITSPSIISASLYTARIPPILLGRTRQAVT